jgi:putative tricarboxylic transport membrane protein
MRPNDLTTGLLLIAGGLAVAGYAQTFPPMPGQNIGPSFFPTVIGVCLGLVGAVLARSGWTRRGTPRLDVPPVRVTPRALARIALVTGVLIAYAAIVETLGFLLTGVLFLSILFAGFGVRRTWIVPLAIGVTVAMHYGFYTVLRVPLPWGVLEAIAW